MEKSSRPVRNRKRSRKAWPPGDVHRPTKRLFTPEIKRMLKDWLVRRRENPYPNRDEKKLLANETGLTYTQICNWFANWRRKLKNSGNDPARKTWGNLIKNYNTNARGNVEQFSICSNDSIWGENGDDSRESRTPPPDAYTRYPRLSAGKGYELFHNHQQQHNSCANMNNNNSSSFHNNNGKHYIDLMKIADYGAGGDRTRGTICSAAPCFDHCYTPKNYETVFGPIEQPVYCKVADAELDDYPQDYSVSGPSIVSAIKSSNGTFYLTPSTTLAPSTGRSSSKYKNSIMEKYLRDLGEVETDEVTATVVIPFQQPFPTVGTIPPPNGFSCEAVPLRGTPPSSLSKWLESTAKFTPSKNNYIDWDASNGRQPFVKKRHDSGSGPTSLHQKDEIDAAEALTRLANNFRTKFYT